MKPIPIYDATADIACTAAAEEIAERIAQIERLRSHLVAVDRTADGLLLHFPNLPQVDAELRRFAVDEKACCQFWGFAVTADPEQLHLRWEAPPALSEHMTRLHELFESDEPLAAASGLL